MVITKFRNRGSRKNLYSLQVHENAETAQRERLLWEHCGGELIVTQDKYYSTVRPLLRCHDISQVIIDDRTGEDGNG